MVEGQRRRAAGRLHDREAHGIGVADALVGEPIDPLPRIPVMLARGEFDRDTRAGLDPGECSRRRPDPPMEQQPPVDLGED